ncbi:hypothetical protein CAPTEDRAFT_25228, partial [Capitella teleta]
NVTNIYLRNNEIVGVPAGTFTNYTNLEFLDMTSNVLREISPTAFTGTNIKNLDNAFSDFKRLAILHLSWNRLTFISPTAFTGTRIKRLLLDHNLLTNFPDLAQIGSTLIGLEIQYNRIEQMNADQLSSLTQLDFLDLSENKNLPAGLPFKHGFVRVSRLYLKRTLFTNITNE